jgi:hypothetical protein
MGELHFSAARERSESCRREGVHGLIILLASCIAAQYPGSVASAVWLTTATVRRMQGHFSLLARRIALSGPLADIVRMSRLATAAGRSTLDPLSRAMPGAMVLFQQAVCAHAEPCDGVQVLAYGLVLTMFIWLSSFGWRGAPGSA